MKTLKNDRGAILLFTLGIMVALLLIGAASSLITRSDRQITRNVREATRALYVAEAGLGWAHARLRGADPVLYFDPAATFAGGPVSFAEGSYEVSIGARDADGRRVVNAIGRVEGIARSLTARFRRFGLDPVGSDDCFGPGDADADGICDGRPGITSNRSLAVPAGSRVDGFHGDAGPYAAGSASARGSIATNGTLTLAGISTVLRGDAFVGESFEPGLNTHEGGKQLGPAFFLPPLPSHASVCSGVTNPALVDCNPPYGTLTTVLAGSPPDETLTVGPGQTICMPAGLYCFRRVVVQAGGVLRIVDDPATGTSTLPTTLRLGTPSSGNPAFDVRGRIEYGAGMKPNLLRVFSRADVDVAGWSGGRLVGLFYAPRASVRLNTQTTGWTFDVDGLVAADRVSFGNGPVRFHADEDGRFGDLCANATDPTCKPAFVLRERWVEDRS